MIDIFIIVPADDLATQGIKPSTDMVWTTYLEHILPGKERVKSLKLGDTHVNLAIIGSGDGLLPVMCQAFT